MSCSRFRPSRLTTTPCSENRRCGNSADDEGVEFKDVLKHLDREETQVLVRLETRKFRKPTTIIQGLVGSKEELGNVARKLKHSLATGGTSKEGLILLQGDHRSRIKDELVRLGFPAENIEVV